MKRACLLLLPVMLLIILAITACNEESKPVITRVRVSPACGVVPLQVETFAAVSGGVESGDPMGGTNNLETTWTFGDGGQGSTAISFHRYTMPGEYTVTVTAKDPDGNTATSSVPVSVLADSLAISAISNFPDGNVTTADTIRFSMTVAACGIDYPTVPGDSVKMTYRWEMADTETTVFKGTSPSFVYPVAGEYDARIAVTYPALAVTRRATLHFSVADAP